MINKIERNRVVEQYWLQHYLNKGACSLCGNSGLIDTTDRAVTAKGEQVGRVNYCICPNGQIRRGLGDDQNEKDRVVGLRSDAVAHPQDSG